MIRIEDKSKCTGCTACASICNHKAIKMQYDEYGHSYPIVDKKNCAECGLCEKACPLLNKENIIKEENNENLLVYAAYNKDTEVRKKSTSGGVFSLLAEFVLSKGGVVYAACFDDNFNIIHDCFTTMDDIEKYRGSKYAQSDLGETFRKVKQDVKSKLVLFVGTPCQVAGLKSFLKNKTENLVTCDFICLGISSPVIWNEYLDAFRSRKSIKKIFFKDKRLGWHQWQMLVEDKEGEHLCLGMNDPFFNGYLTHLTFRPSCFECSFRKCNRVSDFTIADCWGIDNYDPKFDDNKGCTTIILQSIKSVEIFEALKNRMNVIEYPISNVLKYNPYIIKKISIPAEREAFYKLRRDKGYKVAALKYCIVRKPTIINRIINKIKSIL